MDEINKANKEIESTSNVLCGGGSSSSSGGGDKGKEILQGTYLQEFDSHTTQMFAEEWKNFFLKKNPDGTYSSRSGKPISEEAIRLLDERKSFFELLNIGKQYVLFYRDSFIFTHEGEASTEQTFSKRAKVIITSATPNISYPAGRVPFILYGSLTSFSGKMASGQSFTVPNFLPDMINISQEIYHQSITINSAGKIPYHQFASKMVTW